MIVLTVITTVLLADVPAPVTGAVSRHNAALADVQAKKKNASVQRAFEAAIAVRTALDEDAVASLTDEDLLSLQESLPALRLTRDAAPMVDGSFFTNLAEQHGTTADADFFSAWTAANPVDAKPCTDFTGLPDRYKSWFAFARRHKSAYKALVIEEITRVEEDIMKATCACEDRDAVRQTYATLAREFPTSRITQRVRQRVHDIDRGVSDIRFSCESSGGVSEPSPAPSSGAR